MRAAVYKGGQQFTVEDLPDPTPGPGQVVIDVNYCAICGTDVHHFLYDIAPPGTVMGHEYSGVVSSVGEGVSRWSVGDRVVGGGGEPPAEVRAASPNRGERFNYRLEGFSGASSRVRAYAEKVLLEEWEPVPIPEGVSDEEAAMCEPCAVTVHAVRLSQLRLGDSVVVLGAGPIGLLCMQVARAAGASRVIVSEPAPARAEAARRLGADAVINPLEEDAVERGRGAYRRYGSRSGLRMRGCAGHARPGHEHGKTQRTSRPGCHRLERDACSASRLDGA